MTAIDNELSIDPREPDIAVFSLLRSRIRWILIGGLLGVIVAIAFLRSTDYYYTATLRVTPVVAQSSANSTGLSTLANLAGVSIGRGDAVKPFVLYLQLLRSRELDAVLARDPALLKHVFARSWDGKAWREPPSLTHAISAAVRGALGSPVAPWHPPAAAEVDRWLTRRLAVAEDPKNGLATITLDDADPAFAQRTLGRIHELADEGLRRRKLQRTGAYIAYLERTLTTVTLAEHRGALAVMLGDQEKDRMIASSEATAYAAEPLGAVGVSDAPTSPDPWLTLLGGFLVGTLLAGLAAVNIRRAKS